MNPDLQLLLQVLLIAAVCFFVLWAMRKLIWWYFGIGESLAEKKFTNKLLDAILTELKKGKP